MQAAGRRNHSLNQGSHLVQSFILVTAPQIPGILFKVVIQGKGITEILKGTKTYILKYSVQGDHLIFLISFLLR